MTLTAAAPAPSLTGTSIGRKLLMAMTGAVLVFYVLGHMVGNLQFYLGPAAIDAYARALRRFPPLLWAARLVLLACAIVHVVAAVQTTVQSWRSRQRYRHAQQFRAATWSSRTMRLSGLLLFAFIVYHVVHLTFGVTLTDFQHGQVYRNMIVGFSDPRASGSYIAAMTILGAHLLHGIWSLFQTCGTNNAGWSARWRAVALTVTALVVLGNISIPVSVLAGWMR